MSTPCLPSRSRPSILTTLILFSLLIFFILHDITSLVDITSLTFKTPLRPTSKSPPLPQSLNIEILTVSDRRFVKRFLTQSNSIKCYAHLQNYTYTLLDPYKPPTPCTKNHDNFFFLKHCAVAHHLETHPEIDVAIVLDGDIVAANPISIKPWLETGSDIIFYERSWNSEIMSGAYAVRNTAVGRGFLEYWAGFEHVVPPGFSSSDNGAIHLAIIDTLGIKGRKQCRQMYDNLTAGVDNLKPYYDFVACTKGLLGPPRVHSFVGERDGKRYVAGGITIFPRMFGLAIDSYVQPFAMFLKFPPFHHGVKNADWVKEYRVGKKVDEACNRSIHERDAEYVAEEVRRSDLGMLKKMDGEMAYVPRWGHLDEGCYQRLWCTPMPSPVAKWPVGYVVRKGKLEQVKYVDPGVDERNVFLESIEERGEL